MPVSGEKESAVREILKYYPRMRTGDAERLRIFLSCPGPLEIELGCGKGRFITDRAERYPKTRFVAVDRAAKWLQVGEKRAQKHLLSNLVFVRANAFQVLEEFVKPRSVREFHIYFPDPWPKKRHQKRRFVNPAMMDLLWKKLKKGGRVFLATDEKNYAEAIRTMIPALPVKWQVRESLGRRLNPDEVIQTHYELKYEKEGRPLFYMELKKP